MTQIYGIGRTIFDFPSIKAIEGKFEGENAGFREFAEELIDLMRRAVTDHPADATKSN